MTEVFTTLSGQNTAPDPAARIAEIKAALKAARGDAGRKADSVTITAVTKKHGREAIVPALEAGHRIFGENRVQEAAAKWPSLRARYRDIELRLIGPLQSNKAGDAVALFDVIETVDRLKIARALAREMTRQNRQLRLLVQINTGDEGQKAGVSPQLCDPFIAECREKIGLGVEGLMCIPPADEDPAPHFALLAKIAKRNRLDTLSMGMSGDYVIAARLGATHVRIGTGIFGPRPA